MANEEEDKNEFTELVLKMKKSSAERIFKAACELHSYREKFEDGAGNSLNNPESKADFTKRMLIGVMKEWVKQYEVEGQLSIS
jgi:hypothetical protein